MKPPVRHIALFLSALLVLCGTGSCILKRDYGSDPETEDGKALFVLHIAPVSTRAATDGVAEKIKSLRIIAVGKDEDGKNGVIEINRKVDFNDVESAIFGYALTWWTRPGKKDFYIFANEENVKNIQFTDNQRPDRLGKNAATLTALLDGYPATPAGTLNGELTGSGMQATGSNDNTVSGDDDGAQARAEEFKEVINAVYFAPNYEIEEADGQRTVYLPYSTVYEDVDVTAKKDDGAGGGAGQTAAGDSYWMYLVPVATQFIFNFHNYRLNPVEIQKIEVSYTHTENFLLAQVGEKELQKTFDNENYYWVDWLAKVAEASQLHPGSSDNSDINARYGWISDYTMPSNNEGPAIFVSESDEKCEIPAGRKNNEEEEVAESLTVGPFYRPESRHEVTVKKSENSEAVEDVTEQQYLLTLCLHDTTQDPEADPVFEDVVIENLRSLFRNTQVVINVTLRQGNVDVYAEIAPWNEKKANGWVFEGEAPKSGIPGQTFRHAL